MPAAGTHEELGEGAWAPEWGTLVAGAHTLTVHVSVGTGTGPAEMEGSGTGYRIKGRNPSNAQIAAQASSPWYATRLIRAESSCRQFQDGYPLESESGDHGYGLMQITNPPPTEADLWRWTTNVATGLSLLREDKIAWADGFWEEQVEQWEDYNKMMDPDVPHPPDRTYHGITFGYDSGKPLRDGLAIKYYNGNGCRKRIVDGKEERVTPGCETGAWLAWQNEGENDGVTPYWAYNEGDGYVEDLVGKTPCIEDD